MNKKLFLLIFFIIMILQIGCTKNIEQKQQPFSVSVLYNNVEGANYQEDWLIFEQYKNKFDIDFNVILGDDTNFEKEIDLHIQSDNAPDIILKCYPDFIKQYANDGLLLAISDYTSMMPHFLDYIEKNGLEDEIEKLKLDNGKFYIMPGYQRETQVQQWIYREDLFTSNGLATPKTYDELFDALVILKSLYPDTTPITASWGGAHLFSMMGAGYKIPGGWSGTQYYDDELDKWLYAPATKNYQEMYRFLNKCYEAGILDNDLFVQTNEEFLDKLVNGKALVTVTWITSGFETWNQQLRDNGFPEGNWKPLPVLESTIGIKALPSVNKFRKGLVVLAKVANEPYFEDLITFLDWAIYSDEGMELTTWGVLDTTFTKASGYNDFLPEIIASENGIKDLKKDYGLQLVFNLNENEAFENYKKPDEIVSFLRVSQNANETLEMAPALNLSASSISAISLITDKLTAYSSEAGYQFITGELSIDNDWDMYISKLNDYGYTIVEQIWNDRWETQRSK